MKKGLKGTIPALVNSRVGSPAGMREAEGICWCPLLSKNLMNESLIWSPFMAIDSILTQTSPGRSGIVENVHPATIAGRAG